MFIVLAHWAEHLAQATQIYILHRPVPTARGVLGLWLPWLIKSETLHYGYALVMLTGLWLLRKGFQGRSHTWWMIAFWIQFWHHIEHAGMYYHMFPPEGEEPSHGCSCAWRQESAGTVSV